MNACGGSDDVALRHPRRGRPLSLPVKEGACMMSRIKKSKAGCFVGVQAGLERREEVLFFARQQWHVRIPVYSARVSSVKILINTREGHYLI